MVKDIVVYPDKRLKGISKEVEIFDETLHQLLEDMYDTMIAKNGVGLAAIQIGVPLRVLIINIPIEINDEETEQPKENTLEMINPIIQSCSGVTENQEGCLSVPSFFEAVERYEVVSVTYRDRHGNEQMITDDTFLAIAIQHEMDHLNGKLFVEKLSYNKRKKFEKEWKRRQKEESRG